MTADDRWEQLRQSDGFLRSLRVLRGRWALIVAIILVCVGVSVFRHERGSKSYTASASVVFQSGTAAEAALQVSPSSSTEPIREADTEVFIAHSPEVATAVRYQLKTRAKPSQLLEQVKAEAEPSANILNIVASTGDPLDSSQLANAFAEQYIAFRAKSELADINTVQTRLQDQLSLLPAGSAERTNLEESLQRLSELRAVAGSGASIIGRATPPTSPSGSSLSTAIVLGFLIGIALAFSIVFVVESLDRRIKTIEEFEREYRLPTLAAMPQFTFRSGRAADRTELLEPYRILRSALDFAAVTRQMDTLMVTSAMPGEGKTTVAVDLAHTIALTGRRVALIELDLRRPTFTEHFSLRRGEGLTTALTQDRPITDLMVEPFEELPNFSVLPAGRLPHNPSELLGSQRITDVITSLIGGEGIVVIDAPPLNPIADAQVLLNNPAVHASILVARVNKTTREDVRRARAILDRHMVEPIGVVITGLREMGGYGYGYGYGPLPDNAPSLDVSVEAISDPSGSKSRRR